MLRPKFYFHTDGTMLMLGFDCAARMTRRPILPNPLIPTRIDMVFFCACASTASRVAARYSVAAGASLEIFICEPPAQGLPSQLGSASVRCHYVHQFRGQERARECKHKAQPARQLRASQARRDTAKRCGCAEVMQRCKTKGHR